MACAKSRRAHETRVMIPSLKVKDYTQHPEMSATYITSALIHSLRSQPACLYVVNYANADMVGHSGDFLATVKACEVIDQQLAILYHEVVERLGGNLIITADHGNAEEKVSADGKPLTAHTTNPVPFVVVSQRYQHKGVAAAPMEPVYGLAQCGADGASYYGAVDSISYGAANFGSGGEMKGLSPVERFWGMLAHVPLITMIWFSYMLYHHYKHLSMGCCCA